jgi:membrane protein DedA with SNARE-associated domain
LESDVLPTDFASFTALIRMHSEIAYGLMFAFASGHAMLYVLFAGYMAQAGVLDPVKLGLACLTGSFVGDVVRFWIARAVGIGWLNGIPRLMHLVERIAKLAERNSVWMILTHRYPLGIRGVAAFAYGLSQIPWIRFLPLNLIAATIWAVGMVAAGYGLGHVSESVLQQSASRLGALMLIAFLGIAWLLSRRLERSIEGR